MKRPVASALLAIAAIAALVYFASTGSEKRPVPVAPEPSDEERRLMSECYENWESKKQIEKAARDAESKDPEWAPVMEQKLREFTTRRFESNRIEILGIDCMTTFCDLQAQSFTAEAAAEFRSGMDAFWPSSGDFRGMSAKRSDLSEKTLHAVQLKRSFPGDTARADADDEPMDSTCLEMVNLRTEREVAAVYAQPRDADWAVPMEQRLRWHLLKRLAGEPIEKLEIGCLTTVCRITAHGRTTQARAALDEAMEAVASERWANLRFKAVLNRGHSNDEWIWEYTLMRR